MRSSIRGAMTMIACMAVLATAAVVEAQGGGSGKGQGGGSGGQGGGQQGGSQSAVLYGDLYVVERDGNGIPVTKTFTYVGEKGPITEVCLQPIAASCALLPLKGDAFDFNPAVDEACDVQVAYVGDLQEVTFGRQSVARTSTNVIDRAYYEALANINAAAAADTPTPYGLDPAGRVVLTLPDETTGALVEKTIDAPLENLGLYRALMTAGCLGPVTVEREPGVPLTMELSGAAKADLAAAGLGHLVCGTAPEPIGDLDMFRAAAFYAAAADKSDPVALDEIVNVNTYLGINRLTAGTTPRTKKELTITWFEFEIGDAPYRYDRATTHAPGPLPGSDSRVLPTDAFILVDANPGAPGTEFLSAVVPLFAGSPPGVELPAVQVCRAGAPYQDETGASRYCLSADDPGGECGGANWFTQTAEDARKIIWFLHNWAVPEIRY